MKENVFDQVARDYEKIHNQWLPPGVPSAVFIHQRAARVTEWILSEYRGQKFCYLDFGCGNGRMLKCLLGSDPLKPMLSTGRLRLFGFDTSAESLNEARTLLYGEPVTLVNNWREFPRELRFDLVLSCHVFHHIPRIRRPKVVTSLHRWMKPASRLVIWEQNPVNPITRLLVKLCPFDNDARLLTMRATQALLGQNGFRPIQSKYINLLPPRWLRSRWLVAIETQLLNFPIGAQYWVMFERHR
ncbi:MAG: class I SAM-dependent methyltransferase [Pseudomonadota bacterium]